MRLHTNVMEKDLHDAVRQAGANIQKLTVHRSTVRPHAYEVTLSGDGTRWANDGQYGRADYKAASWDQWGIVLAFLYERDPAMIVGSPGRPTYRDAEHFHAFTTRRYDVGVGIYSPNDDRYHGNHTWNVRDAVHPVHGYLIQACKCGAMRDWSV